MLIATSLLSVNKDERKMREIDATSTDYLHLDVMDGKFVDNTSAFDQMTYLKKPLDVHFMVEDVYAYIEKYLPLHPEYMTFHLEIDENIDNLIDVIKGKGIKVGISIKPGTEVDALLPYLAKIDLVLVMSVEPGYGGQTFIEEMVSKIDALKALKEDRKYTYQIEVDGGINLETCIKCKNADILVVGSFIANASLPEENVQEIRKRF